MQQGNAPTLRPRESKLELLKQKIKSKSKEKKDYDADVRGKKRKFKLAKRIGKKGKGKKK